MASWLDQFRTENIVARRENAAYERKTQAELDYQRRLAEQQQQESAGLLKPLLSQFGPGAAQEVGGLLTSASPQAQALGAQQLQGLLNARKTPDMRARELDVIGQAQLQNEQLRSARLVQEYQQAAAMGPLNEAVARSRVEANQARAVAARQSAELARSGKISSAEYNLQGRYLTQIESAAEVSDATQQIDAALAGGDSLGALVAVVKLAKVLDPTSVVREGEVTTVQGGTGTAENLIAQYNKAFGKGFSAEGAQRFRDVTRSVAEPVLRRGQRISSEFARAAELAGARPEAVQLGAGFDAAYVARYLGGQPDPAVQADHEL